MHLTRKKKDTGFEKRIVTGMIVSKKFNRGIHPIVKFDYFDNSYCREIAKWCYNFFDKYEDAPFNHIQDIYEKYSIKLSDEDAELIEVLLKEINQNFTQQGHKYQTGYMLKEALQYFQKKEMEIMLNNVRILIDEDKIDQATEEIVNCNKVSAVTSEVIDPFDPNTIKSTFDHKKEDFFKFPKSLGDFIGPMDQGWLIAISGQFKLGKTWFLQEFLIVALLSRLNIIFFSLEMTENQMLSRLYKRLAPGSDKGEVYPVFDCKKNQDGSCHKTQRTNQYRLLDKNGQKPNYNPKIAYKPCTVCRGTQDFELDTWFRPIKLLDFSENEVSKRVKTIRKTFGDRIKLKSFPRFSANLSDIKSTLDLIKHADNFIPDVIIIDYADILKPESKDMGVQKEDLTWMALARLAGEQKALVVTATQVTKDALGADNVKLKHTARWIGKLGHVDAMYTLNQTDEEKHNGIMRIGTMVHRHFDFSESKQCAILQNLNVGQALLDSEMI